MVLFLGSLLLAPPPRLSLLPLSVPTLLCAHPTPVDCACLAPSDCARLVPEVYARLALCLPCSHSLCPPCSVPAFLPLSVPALLPRSVPTLLCAHLASSVCAHPALCSPSLPRPVQQQHGAAQRRHSGHLGKECRMDSAQAVDPASAVNAPCMSGGEPGTGGGALVWGAGVGGRGCGTWAGAAGLPCPPDPASPHS